MSTLPTQNPRVSAGDWALVFRSGHVPGQRPRTGVVIVASVMGDTFKAKYWKGEWHGADMFTKGTRTYSSAELVAFWKQKPSAVEITRAKGRVAKVGA